MTRDRKQEPFEVLDAPTAANRFLGLSGAWKQVTLLGISGVVAALLAYLVIWGGPHEREQLVTLLREDAGENRRAIRELTEAIRSWTEELRRERVRRANAERENREGPGHAANPQGAAVGPSRPQENNELVPD